MPDIRELYEKADWPIDGLFAVEDGGVIALPDGAALQVVGLDAHERRVTAAFIVEACNYWLKHLRGGAEREAARKK